MAQLKKITLEYAEPLYGGKLVDMIVLKQEIAKLFEKHRLTLTDISES